MKDSVTRTKLCKTAEKKTGPEMLNCADKLALCSLVIFALMATVMSFRGNVALRNISPFFRPLDITFPILLQRLGERGQCLVHYHNFSSGDFCTGEAGSY